MAFETRRRGQQEIANRQEASGDVAQLNTMSPRVQAPTAPGAGRAQRIRDIQQKNQLYDRTTNALQQAQNMDMQKAANIRAQASLALQKRGMDFSQGMQTQAFNRAETWRGQDQAEDLRRHNLGQANLTGRDAESQRRWNLNRKDQLMKTFEPEDVQAYLAGEGGQQPSTQQWAQRGISGEREPDPVVVQLDSYPPQYQVTYPGQKPVVLSAEEFKEFESNKPPPAATATQPRVKRGPTVNEARKSPRTPRQVREGAMGNTSMPDRDLTRFEGQQGRVGDKNNVRGMWFKDPDTGKQEFVGESELKRYYGDKYNLPKKGSASSVRRFNMPTDKEDQYIEENTTQAIKYRPNMQEMPTTEAGQERLKKMRAQAAEQAPQKRPVLGMRTREDGMRMRKKATGKGQSGSGKPLAASKLYDSYARDAINSGVAESELYKDGEQTPKGKAYNQYIAQGMSQEAAAQQANLRKTGYERADLVNERDQLNKELERVSGFGKEGGWLDDSNRVDSMQARVKAIDSQLSEMPTATEDLIRPPKQKGDAQSAPAKSDVPEKDRDMNLMKKALIQRHGAQATDMAFEAVSKGDRADKRRYSTLIRNMLANPSATDEATGRINSEEVVRQYLKSDEIWSKPTYLMSQTPSAMPSKEKRAALTKDRLANSWATKIIRQGAGSSYGTAGKSEIGYDKAFRLFKRMNEGATEEDFKYLIWTGGSGKPKGASFRVAKRHFEKIAEAKPLKEQAGEKFRSRLRKNIESR